MLLPGTERDTPRVWAGIECTLNRVGDTFRDQCDRNGHRRRLTDLELFASLGAERIRYPFLWEHIERTAGTYDWSWADGRQKELRRCGLTPIAGLLHHGSGPAFTHLLDPAFPEKFAAFARAFAERYPEVRDYTPINEPLTTARFSGLYGIWYPHGRSDREFLRALSGQIKATVLAMREIRRVQPAARLIQTEDLGRTSGTAPLLYQVEFENERRWLTYDLLAGRVYPEHFLYPYLRQHGLSEAELAWFRENTCPPDVIGLNHYLLSNRFLDHELRYYPPALHGGNGHDRYADVGAVDSGRATLPTPYSVFREAWERYARPLAVTEVHIHGPREAQMRWLHEIWRAATELKHEGVDFRAVTAWSLLGSYDWNSLCTEQADFYESGVFDLRAPRPRPTALAKMIAGLAHGGSYRHPLLEQKGWWKNSGRARFAPEFLPGAQTPPRGRPIVITGGHGTLGRAFARICEARGLPYRLLSRADLDITDDRSVAGALEKFRPWALVNAAGYVKVDEAEREPERCFRENVLGPEILARRTSADGVAFLSFSTDMVFDGEREDLYVESHAVRPLNVYGRSKALAEEKVLAHHAGGLVVRTSSFFGPWDQYNFVTMLLHSLAEDRAFPAASDLTITPTYVPDLVHACLDLLIDGESGIIHLTNGGRLTWAELARAAFNRHEPFLGKAAGERILARPSRELSLLAPRPRNSALGTERAQLLPPLENALDRYFHEREYALPGQAKPGGTLAS